MKKLIQKKIKFKFNFFLVFNNNLKYCTSIKYFKYKKKNGL